MNMKRTGGGWSDSLTHWWTQNNHRWPQQLRTEQGSFLLLCAPAGASHGATCDGQQQQRYRSGEGARERPLQAWQKSTARGSTRERPSSSRTFWSKRHPERGGLHLFPQVRHVFFFLPVNIATQECVSLVSRALRIMFTRSSLLSIRPGHTAAGVFQLALLTESNR